jgi:hypothetical protein
MIKLALTFVCIDGIALGAFGSMGIYAVFG